MFARRNTVCRGRNEKSGVYSRVGRAGRHPEPMTSGGMVVEDYAQVGLVLWAHPVSLPPRSPTAAHSNVCRSDGGSRCKRLRAAGLVLVRHRLVRPKALCSSPSRMRSALPISSSGSRRLITPVLPDGMAGVYGKVQRERSVVHLVAHRLTDLSAELDSVGDRGGTFPTQRGRGDELRHGSRYRDPRGINLAQDTRNPREHIDQIKAPTPDFR